MRTPVRTTNHRRVLCVFPAYAPAFGTFSHAFRLVGAKAFMPPQGLLLIANYLPSTWAVRFIDENMQRAQQADFEWADAVFVTGMHIQAAEIHDVCRRANACGKPTALGGPSVSAAPEKYPDYDYLHIGELGAATNFLIARIDATIDAPPRQIRYASAKRLPLTKCVLLLCTRAANDGSVGVKGKRRKQKPTSRCGPNSVSRCGLLRRLICVI